MKLLLNRKIYVFLLSTVILTVWLSKAYGSPTVPAGYASVAKSDIIKQTTVAGVVLPNRKTLIIPPYVGYVRKIYVKMGQVVKQNDPVVSLVQNLRDMHDESFPLRAPFGGTVVQISKSEGEYVDTTKQSALIRIDDLSQLFVLSEVPESEVTKLQVGMEVGIKVNGIPDKSYKGKLVDIAQAPQEKEGGGGRPGERVEFQIRSEILDKDDKIRSGMSTLVDIVTSKKLDVLSLPLESVEKKGNEYFVTLDSGKRKQIKIGIQNDEKFEVVEGLSENERVKLVDFYNLNTKM